MVTFFNYCALQEETEGYSSLPPLYTDGPASRLVEELRQVVFSQTSHFHDGITVDPLLLSVLLRVATPAVPVRVQKFRSLRTPQPVLSIVSGSSPGVKTVCPPSGAWPAGPSGRPYFDGS